MMVTYDQTSYQRRATTIPSPGKAGKMKYSRLGLPSGHKRYVSAVTQQTSLLGRYLN